MIDLCQLPIEICDFFCKRRISTYKLIEYNNYKGRYCLKFESEGSKYFIKYNDKSDKHIAYYDTLQKEIQIYDILEKLDIVPTHFKNNDFLITEFIENSSTLRYYIKKYLPEVDMNDKNSPIFSALDKWQKFIVTVKESSFDTDKILTPKKEFRTYVSSLLLSGPWGTEASVIEKTRNKLLRYILLFLGETLYRKELKVKCIDSLPFIHGDFHLNNVLVNSNECRIIDFENVHRGLPELELAYFYAQLWILIRNDLSLLSSVDKYIDSIVVIENKSFYKKMAKLFQYCISKNRRFK